MKQNKKQGILVNGSVRSAGVTFYSKQGQTIVRSSVSRQPKRRTPAQFDVRQRMAHNSHLWMALRHVSAPLMTQHQFYALAASLPAVYLTQGALADGATLLLPGIPVACGTLPTVATRLGSVDGQPALLTDLGVGTLGGDLLLLLTVRQRTICGVPRLSATVVTLAEDALTVVDGRLALVDEAYGDSSCGWALVRRRGSLCSTARLVTASTAYTAYQTPVALQRAAASYGGLTP